MRVIIGCEFSQIVTKAFRDIGHEAYSCDILPTEGNPNWHFQEDIFEVLKREKPFDLGIFHPPCTYLSNAGIAWFNEEKYGDKAKERKQKRLKAAKFFMQLYNLDIPKIAIENPVGWMNVNFRKPDQIVRPYYFGESEQKNICLWLKNLPKLIYIKQEDLFQNKTYIGMPEPARVNVRRPNGVNIAGKIKKRYFTDKQKTQHERSRFFVSIANAMATQWSEIV
jgi:hypothetical protein